jgi:hypothetical protein
MSVLEGSKNHESATMTAPDRRAAAPAMSVEAAKAVAIQGYPTPFEYRKYPSWAR